MTARKATDYDKQIGSRIRAERWRAGITQAELGDDIGVGFQQVQKYELGTNRISASNLVKAAVALQCDVMQLLPEEAQDLPDRPMLTRRAAQLAHQIDRLPERAVSALAVIVTCLGEK